MNKINLRWNSKQYTITQNQPPLIIAEAGVNHNGDINLAKKLVDAAKKAGADFVKFQSFITEEITTPTSEAAGYIKRNVREKKWYGVLKKLELSHKIQKALFNYCKKKDIVFLSTPYDHKSADFLERIGIPIFKIASTDINNIPLIEHIAKKGIPMIISTGISTIEEVKDAINAAKKMGNSKIIVMQCTSNYPASIEAANIKVIDTYKRKFKVLAGYSDHTNGELCAILAVGQGAVIFEKHFTKDKNLPGPDQKASADPKEMKRYIKSIKSAYTALGDGIKRIAKEEKDTKSKMQKSITSTRFINKGERILENDIRIRRPATGLAPKRIGEVIGKKAARDIKADVPIVESDLIF